jgi:hypothetical protein
VINDGFVFRANRLCIPVGSVHLLLIYEVHGGRLMGYFGAKKTEDVLASHFFWPKMRRDVEQFIACCTTCQKAKTRLNPHGLYMPLPVPSIPWAYISMDFVLGLLRTNRWRENIFVIVDRFLSLYHIIKVMMLFILLTFSKEIVHLHGMPATIVSDHDAKFLSHFWRTLWNKLGTKLLLSTTLSSTNSVAGCFEEEFKDVGRMFTSCGIFIQSGNVFYHKGKSFSGSVWF